MFAAWLTSPKGTAPLRPPNSKILDHPGIVQNFLLGSLAHLQLARAYVVSGNTAQAKAAYQDFLTPWKDTAPDIPILKEAKTEYAKLQ